MHLSHRFDLKQRSSPIVTMVNTQSLLSFLPKGRTELLSGELSTALGRAWAEICRWANVLMDRAAAVSQQHSCRWSGQRTSKFSPYSLERTSGSTLSLLHAPVMPSWNQGSWAEQRPWPTMIFRLQSPVALTKMVLSSSVIQLLHLRIHSNLKLRNFLKLGIQTPLSG